MLKEVNMNKLPTELATEILVAWIGAGRSALEVQDLAKDFGILFHKILQCHMVELKEGQEPPD